MGKVNNKGFIEGILNVGEPSCRGYSQGIPITEIIPSYKEKFRNLFSIVKRMQEKNVYRC